MPSCSSSVVVNFSLKILISIVSGVPRQYRISSPGGRSRRAGHACGFAGHFRNSPLGEPVAFDISSSIPESEAPGMSFPLPSGIMLMQVSCSAQTVLAPGFTSQSGRWSSAIPQTHNITREGPFDAYCSPMDTGDYPLVSACLPGCPYRFTSYTAPLVADTDPAFGIQLHHPQFLEFAGAPESARLLFRSPAYWVHHLDQEDAIAAAVNLQRDAGLMTSNLQALSQFVTSLDRMLSEVLHLAMGRMVFPSSEVSALSPTGPPTPRATRAAHYMASMGLWAPPVGPGGPGPLPTSSCNMCMNCSDCLPAGAGRAIHDITFPRYDGPVGLSVIKTPGCGVTDVVLCF